LDFDTALLDETQTKESTTKRVGSGKTTTINYSLVLVAMLCAITAMNVSKKRISVVVIINAVGGFIKIT